MFQAGAFVVSITPPLGISMSGDFTGRLARRVAADLTARALVFDDGDSALALVILDLIIVTADVVAAARQLIAERIGLQPDRVMISATHTHTGPALWTAGNEAPDPGYVASLPGKIAAAVDGAYRRLRPAQIAFGSAKVDGLCFNRRIRMRDGRVTMNFMLMKERGGFRIDEMSGASGPTDPEITALLIEDLDFNPIALWAVVPCHHGDTDDDLAYSPDYFGRFAAIVPRALGDQCVGFLANGTSGNINTIDVNSAVRLPYGDKRGGLVANAIFGAALQSVALRPRARGPRIDARSWRVPVRRRATPDADLDLARRIIAAAQSGVPPPEPGFSFVAGDPIPPTWAELFARETLAVADMPNEIETELQIARIGEFAIAGLPGEFFVEYGLALKAQSPFDQLSVITMTNDHIGYVPTPEAMHEGGYETWTARSSWPVAETGAEIVHSVLNALRTMRNNGGARFRRDENAARA